jgi:phosphopantetheinyl transferase
MPKIRPLEFIPAPDRLDVPAAGVHVWRGDLDEPHWPGAEGLPAEERARAESLLRDLSRRRWVASRRLLREVLGRYLRRPPGEIQLESGEHGKPRLATPEHGLTFNLSHSEGLALLAVARDREVGVDVERIVADRHPRDFYVDWTRREARVKCLGIGLTGVPSGATLPIEVRGLELGAEFAASVAVAGAVGTVRGWTFVPTAPKGRSPG